jgi:protein dithiol:quinone oxidoreductase
MFRFNKIFFIIFVLCLASVAYAMYAEFYLNATPCPLCIAQRVIIASIGILAFIFAIHNPKNCLKYIYNLIIGGLAGFCMKIAGHHIWLINLPPEKQPLSCGMPLEILYKKLPINTFISYILQGDAECGKINWIIFGVNAPTAVVILSSVILLLVIYNLFTNLRQN